MTADRTAIRVLLADDEALIRGGLRAIVEAEPDLEVIAAYESGFVTPG
jgi:DNA-binding NarL/FixJ family response regulator